MPYTSQAAEEKRSRADSVRDHLTEMSYGGTPWRLRVPMPLTQAIHVQQRPGRRVRTTRRLHASSSDEAAPPSVPPSKDSALAARIAAAKRCVSGAVAQVAGLTFSLFRSYKTRTTQEEGQSIIAQAAATKETNTGLRPEARHIVERSQQASTALTSGVCTSTDGGARTGEPTHAG